MTVSTRLAPRAGTLTVRLVDRRHPDRSELEGYVRAMFGRHFQANPERLYPLIAELQDGTGRRLGALGLRWGCASPLFSEAYLDEPAESAIARIYRRPVDRAAILEFGHFAANGRGAGRAVILAMAALTARLPVAWMLSTLNAPMRRCFGRAGVPLVELAEADPFRLGRGARCWGRYYESHPRVMAASIIHGRRALSACSGEAEVLIDDARVAR